MTVEDFKRADQHANEYCRGCGKFVLKGRSFDGSHVVYVRTRCKRWKCPYCGPRKACQYRHSIASNAERYHLSRFITLTLDPSKINDTDPVRYLRSCFDKYRTYLRRKYGIAPKYICVLEFQTNGTPHLHLLIDRYIEWSWIKHAWEAVGGGSHVHVEFVDVHRVSHYLSKYLSKELLLSCNCSEHRRVTVARGISLDLNKARRKEHVWTLLRESIKWVFSRRCAVACDLVFDENENLVSFVVRKKDACLVKSPSIGFEFS